MLRIRQEQVDAFQPIAEAEFALRIVNHLREHHPRLVVKRPDAQSLVERMPEDDLLELVKVGIARARSHGFTFSSSISAFVTLMFKAAPNFDQNPTISKSLQDALPEEQRLQRIIENTPAGVWQQAKEQYDPSAWKPSPKGNQK